MQNNWVLLQGRLCHVPNYSATRKGLHKVAFRLAIPRPPRATVGMPAESAVWPSHEVAGGMLPPLGSHSDYVTVIVIGKPAWDFKRLDLQMGAPVRVQGHLRSWDVSPDDASQKIARCADARGNGTRDPVARAAAPILDESAGEESKSPHATPRDYRIEVIAEKIEPLDDGERTFDPPRAEVVSSTNAG